MTDNQIFSDEIEGEMKTRPILEVPTFEPKISVEQFDELNAMDERDRRLVLPLLKTMSVVTQSFSWLVQQHINLTGNVRLMERQELVKSRERKSDFKWLWQTLGGGALMGAGALLSKYFHL